MTYYTLGKFTPYSPTGDNPNNILFLKNKDGKDFYELQKTNLLGDAFFVVDSSNKVVAADVDFSKLFPENLTVIAGEGEVDALNDYQSGLDSELNYYMWNGTAIIRNIPSNSEWLEHYLLKIDEIHAGILRVSVDTATSEEQNTWPSKVEAANASLNGIATAQQETLLTDEASAFTPVRTVVELANIIIEKSNAYLNCIGKAAAFKQQAQRVLSQSENQNEAKGLIETLQTNADTLAASLAV
ncbi:MAG: hypothetical protein HRU29_01835 [Rhizobiales bacterium]|nr:hypothetical protein [Hyphomicrobiales bacterium]NRB13116.1 hypothetical protein [Hyphomicrobiales bacterium]